MRRAVARGRILPQSLSTDPRMGRLSLKAALLFPLMWVNCDDQGRISGDPDEIKYAVCPNIDHISKSDIPELLQELEAQRFIKVYATSRTNAIQMLDWWEEQKLQWAYPSRYPPPEGWTDHLRYHPTPKEIITENWPPSEQRELLPSKLPSQPASAPGKELPSNLESPTSQEVPTELAHEIRAELIGLPYSESRILEHKRIKEALVTLGVRKGYIAQEELEVTAGRIDLCWQDQDGHNIAVFEVETLNPKVKSLTKLREARAEHKFIILRTNALAFQEDSGLVFIGLNRARRKKRQGTEERKIEKEKEGGKGRLPSALGSRSPPSPATLSTDKNQISNKLLESFRMEWGQVLAECPNEIIPREPTGKELAQLRDLVEELVAVGGCPLSYIRDAFREAAGQPEKSKMSISYVRAILLDWLGIERQRPP